MPDLAELTRQYQIAREHQRMVEHVFDGTYSAAEEINATINDVADAYEAMRTAWHGHVFQKMVAGFAP